MVSQGNTKIWSKIIYTYTNKWIVYTNDKIKNYPADI